MTAQFDQAQTLVKHGTGDGGFHHPNVTQHPRHTIFLPIKTTVYQRVVIDQRSGPRAPRPTAYAVYAGHRYARELDAPDIGDAVPFKRELTELAEL